MMTNGIYPCFQELIRYIYTLKEKNVVILTNAEILHIQRLLVRIFPQWQQNETSKWIKLIYKNPAASILQGR